VVTVFDEADRMATGTVSALIADVHPPSASLGLGGLRADQTIGIGDTLELYVVGTDNHRLAYIGYEGAGIRDSVVANLPAWSHTFRLTVSPTWLPVRPVFTAWARDVSGNVSGLGGNSTRMIPVDDGGDRLELTVPLTGQGAPYDAVWDAKRNAVYVLRSNGNGIDGQIDIVHVPSGALGTPIPLPSVPLGFVLSESGDSLLVTFFDPRLLAIVDLSPSVGSATVVPVREDLVANNFARTAQIANGHVFLPLTGGPSPSRLLDLDLATGVQVIRSDIGDGSGLSVGPSLFRLPDGRLFLCPDSPYSYATERFLYSPGSNTFTPTLKLRAAGAGQFSASPSGRFMLGNTVYDAALDSVAALGTQDWREEYGRAAALSADGSTAFLAATYGYEKVRVSDGVLLEQVILDTTPVELLPLPDGYRLIAIGHLPGTIMGEFAVMIVDLR
jgi:hypothetical protein